MKGFNEQLETLNRNIAIMTMIIDHVAGENEKSAA